MRKLLLVIMKFDQEDVNSEYWCSFGFETSRQMLMLDDRHFIGVPENKDIQFTLEQSEQISLDLKIIFSSISKPKCKIKIGNGDWVDEALKLTPVGIRFNAILHYITTIDKSQCSNTITTICSLLSYNILQLNKRLNCTCRYTHDNSCGSLYTGNEKRGKHIMSDIMLFGCSDSAPAEIRWNRNRDLEHPDDAVGIN
ncbi:unnamed protein product [Mytilus edulis]|uniref:Uncharacterized protein n=1 Tax=Mytilus edulis TaxID=6550 RepID=A0A8S3SFB9_MYTED|nr:unnamed protein product [Mytilus edulis]